MSRNSTTTNKNNSNHRTNRGNTHRHETNARSNDSNRTTAPTRPNNNSTRTTTSNQIEPYPPYSSYQECIERYARKDPNILRGKLRAMGGKNAVAFVTCDRGQQELDVCIPGMLERNRALDGDIVFCELLESPAPPEVTLNDFVATNQPEEPDEAGDIVNEEWQLQDTEQDWQDDPAQMDLWNPIVAVPRRKQKQRDGNNKPQQRQARVIYVLPPKSIASEIDPTNTQKFSRRIVGAIKVLQSGTALLTPTNKALPQFRCPPGTRLQPQDEKCLFQGLYEYGSWKETYKWPPCVGLKKMGDAFDIENEVQALLIENEVDHGEFSANVLKDVDQAVDSGVFYENGELSWKPTPDMYKGRRDYRKERIFTIDPTTAKDLDDALHIKELPDGRIEIGVHIADVSYFVQPASSVDREAQRRTTTVYLVDRTIPMLPRPLCEIACSLNENVERLAFSCVWRMNKDGTLRTKGKNVSADDVWYGRTVIQSCARLDYATAQNIIENKVAYGESESDLDEALWPKSRRPTGDHTIEEVAADVRLMHRVAMARRRLRFDNGALSLNGIKLTFQLDSDGQTPLLAQPYPIRDSNRLVEEYMLLANYLVAQRLITHAKERALLRLHPEPVEEGLDKVAEVAKASIGFDLDISSSQALHASLSRLGHECDDELVLQCVTQMLMTPMQPADYFAAGSLPPEAWRHFALNIPYYTHFTSPIRRYADVIVHRLLQATIDGTVSEFELNEKDINEICDHCNEKRMAAKTAQERCDRIFLSLYVKVHPMESQLGIVLSVGVTSFTVFVPSVGGNVLLYLEEHMDVLEFAGQENESGERKIHLTQHRSQESAPRWGTLCIQVFTKILVTVYCRDLPPVDVKVRLEGPYEEDA